MRKLFYIITVFCFNISIIHAQTQADTIHSRHNQIVTSPEDSIAKYKTLSVEAYGKGDLKALKKYADIVLQIAIANNLEESHIRGLVNLAIYYQQTDQYEKALSTYLEAEELTQSLSEDDYLRILVEVNLGNLYNAIGNYEMAEVTMKKVIPLVNTQENPKQILSIAYNTLGTTALYQENFLEALDYMNKVKELGLKMNRKDLVIIGMINTSDCYLKLLRYEDVLANSKEVLQMFTKDDSVENKALALLTVGAAHIGLKNPSEALSSLKEAKKIAIEGGLLKIQMDAHQYLAEAYEALGNIEKSLGEQKAYGETRDVYLKTLSKAQRLKIEKESEAKSALISQQQESLTFLSKEKQIYVFSGIALAVLLIVSSIVYRKKRKKLAQESLQLQGDKELLKNENEALKDKLNGLAKKIRNQETLKEETNAKQHKKPSITIDEQEKYMKHILDYMEEKKPYLNHEIKQSDIADAVGMSVHLFSEVLNTCFQKNFNNFINLYRIDQAKQLMKSSEYKHYKILSIGYEAGFSSKTSFNRIFKDLVGQTPTEYQKEHNHSSN